MPERETFFMPPFFPQWDGDKRRVSSPPHVTHPPLAFRTVRGREGACTREGEHPIGECGVFGPDGPRDEAHSRWDPTDTTPPLTFHREIP